MKTFVANSGKEYGGAKERTQIIDWLDIRAQMKEKRQRNVKNAYKRKKEKKGVEFESLTMNLKFHSWGY